MSTVSSNNSNNRYFSITKFMTTLKPKSGAVLVYFEAADSFVTKFNQIAIKPVCIKTVAYIKHAEVLKLFNGQPVITFKESSTRFNPKSVTKDGLFYLVIDTEEEEFEGISYYPSEMYQLGIKSNVESIRNQEVKQKGKREASTHGPHEEQIINF